MTRSHAPAQTPFLVLAAALASLAAGSAHAQTAEAVRFRNFPAEDQARASAPFGDPAGAVATVVNVDGVKPGALKLTAAVLADIYLGNITRWDAPQIARLNPGLALPHDPIIVVHSADTSSASAGFAGFLAARNPSFRNEVGVGSSLHWSVGVGAIGDAQVSEIVRGAKNSIGFVGYGYAKQNGLPLVRLIDGHSLPTTVIAAPAAAEGAGRTIRFTSDIPAGIPMNDAP